MRPAMYEAYHAIHNLSRLGDEDTGFQHYDVGLVGDGGQPRM